MFEKWCFAVLHYAHLIRAMGISTSGRLPARARHQAPSAAFAAAARNGTLESLPAAQFTADGGRPMRHGLLREQRKRLLRHVHPWTYTIDRKVSPIESSLLNTGNTIFAPSRENCTDETRQAWEDQGEAVQKVYEEWKLARPNGLVLIDNGTQACKFDGPEMGDDGTSKISLNAQVLSLVRKSGDPICQDGADVFRTVEPSLFKVNGSTASRSTVRNYAAVWPLPSVCEEQLCPMVVLLAGLSEHSPVDEKMMYQSFNMMKSWGFLRYAERDSECLAELRSVLVFPQLAMGESWVSDATDLHKHFTVPLVEHMLQQNAHLIDRMRVSVIGYSEGAVGAILAAVLYPNYFTAAVAASASIPTAWWKTVALPPEPESLYWEESHVYKLRSITVCLGTWDFSNEQATNLHYILRIFDSAGVHARTSLQVRLYAGLLHNQVWDRVFNRWAGFHEVFWRGHYDRLLRNDGSFGMH